MSKRLILICILGALAGFFIVLLNPVTSKFLKLLFLGCLGTIWIGVLILVWNKKAFRMTILLASLLGAAPFLLPSGEINTDELRREYVRRMSTLEGTKYHWGGESPRGIDCSGLPRRALRDALLAYGFKNLNGRALRSYIEHWWFDASAKALGEGYRDYTSPLGTVGTIQEMSYAGLIPGDLAVTTNGLHILAYVGDGKWIQADPGIGSVATLEGKTADNSWFRIPVTTHRWQFFSQN